MCGNRVLTFSVATYYLALCYVGSADVPFSPEAIQVGSQERWNVKSASHNISIVGDNFVVDGQPLHILSGSLHYYRLPAAYWRDRLRKLKAAGLNSVSTYVEWSFHEPEERQYSFEGDRDLGAFIGLAAEEGLHVLLRPGPYICAERDLGGLPYWLLGKYPDIRLRTTDKNYMQESKIWLNKLFEQMKPLLFGNGGPIILVQVENEYGSFGADMAYRQQMGKIFSDLVGTDAILYTTDGNDNAYFERGFVPGTLTTIDFGQSTDVKNSFSKLRRFMPHGPLMNSEYYPGWLTHWGESLQTRDTEPVVRTLRDMIDQHINFNIYVFYGGTNFEFTSGANYGYTYQPDITSYDYDAPLTEAGDPTPKYFAIRNLLKEYNFVASDSPEPTPSPKGAYGSVTVTPRVSFLSAEGRSAFGKSYPDAVGTTLPTFEQLQQRSGLVLYETTLLKGKGTLIIQKPRDWIYVFVDGKLQGSINRMYKKYSLEIESNDNSKLSLLTENQGRINFGSRIVDRKGILGTVTYGDKILNGTWKVTGYPIEKLESLNEQTIGTPDFSSGPILFEGTLVLPTGEEPLETFLDTTGWGRGYVWINSQNLGRYWPGLGPQVTLYVPGVWLKAAPATNLVQILELESGPDKFTMEFINYPILNRTLHRG